MTPERFAEAKRLYEGCIGCLELELVEEVDALKSKCDHIRDDSLRLETMLDDWDDAIRDAIAEAGLPPIQQPENYEYVWSAPGFIRQLQARVAELQSHIDGMLEDAAESPSLRRRVAELEAVLRAVGKSKIVVYGNNPGHNDCRELCWCHCVSDRCVGEPRCRKAAELLAKGERDE